MTHQMIVACGFGRFPNVRFNLLQIGSLDPSDICESLSGRVHFIAEACLSEFRRLFENPDSTTLSRKFVLL